MFCVVLLTQYYKIGAKVIHFAHIRKSFCKNITFYTICGKKYTSFAQPNPLLLPYYSLITSGLLRTIRDVRSKATHFFLFLAESQPGNLSETLKILARNGVTLGDYCVIIV